MSEINHDDDRMLSVKLSGLLSKCDNLMDKCDVLMAKVETDLKPIAESIKNVGSYKAIFPENPNDLGYCADSLVEVGKYLVMFPSGDYNSVVDGHYPDMETHGGFYVDVYHANFNDPDTGETLVIIYQDCYAQAYGFKALFLRRRMYQDDTAWVEWLALPTEQDVELGNKIYKNTESIKNVFNYTALTPVNPNDLGYNADTLTVPGRYFIMLPGDNYNPITDGHYPEGTTNTDAFYIDVYHTDVKTPDGPIRIINQELYPQYFMIRVPHLCVSRVKGIVNDGWSGWLSPMEIVPLTPEVGGTGQTSLEYLARELKPLLGLTNTQGEPNV